MRVAIIGTGYVGLTTALSLAYLGHDVAGVDKDSEKINILQNGGSPIHETGLEYLLCEVKNNILFTINSNQVVANADLIIISVGTPQKPNGNADSSNVETVACDIAESLIDGHSYTLVIKSTVPIGTNYRIAHIVSRVLSKREVACTVNIVSNPEFLREGMALRDTFYPDRIIVGAEQQAAVESLRLLYRPILEQTFKPLFCISRPDGYKLPPLITTDPVSAEMIKYAANAFLALKISYINEISGLCEKVGSDVTEVARGIGMDPRIGSRYLQSGLGWGGSCFPKDTAAILALAAEYGYSMPIIEAARRVNMRQRQLVIEKLQNALKVLRGRTIAILGLTFKPETDDLREAPAIDVIHTLLQFGAQVRAHDPVAVLSAGKALQGLDVVFTEDPYSVVEGCDAVVIATEWAVYRKLNLKQLAGYMRSAVMLDARNIYRREDAEKAGFLYMGTGR